MASLPCLHGRNYVHMKMVGISNFCTLKIIVKIISNLTNHFTNHWKPLENVQISDFSRTANTNTSTNVLILIMANTDISILGYSKISQKNNSGLNIIREILVLGKNI